MEETRIRKISNKISLLYIYNIKIPHYIKSVSITCTSILLLNMFIQIDFSVNVILVCSGIILQYLQESLEEYLSDEGLAKNKVESYSNYLYTSLNKMLKDGEINDFEYEILEKELH